MTLSASARQVLAGTALAGVLALLVLFPRTNPAALFATPLDRGQAIQRARQLTSGFGVNTAGWRETATWLADDKLRSYLATYPGDRAALLFTPVAWGVLLTEPAGRQTIRVKLFADGRPAEWELKAAGDPKAPPSSTTVSPQTLLQDFAGVHAAEFAAVPRSSKGGAVRHGWQWSAGKQYPLQAGFEVSERDGHLLSAILNVTYEKGFNANSSSTRILRAVTAGLAGFAAFIGFCIALFFAGRACVRGPLSWRFPVALLALLAVWSAVAVWAGPDYQTMTYNQSRSLESRLEEQGNEAAFNPEANARQQGVANFSYKVSVFISFLGPLSVPFLSGFAFAGAAYAGTQGRYRQKWRSLELMLRGEVFTRQVSRPIAAGALCGIAVAAAPYAVAVPFRHALMLFSSMGVLSAPLPFVSLVHWSAIVPAFGYLGFAFPMAARIRGKWRRAGAMTALGAVYIFGSAGAFNWLAPSLIAAAIGLVIYFQLYQKFDLLSVAAAMVVAQAVAAPGILLVQPAAGLRESGVRLLALFVAGIAVFVNFAIRGRDAQVGGPELLAESEVPSVEGPSLSNRKRLEAEFQVARKAQQDALPATPPVIAGYSFAGSCDPAQQVGGDLYDLFPLRDGRLGIAVADVSGKGVPAALYMMVTKGLLTATVADSSDLAFIMQQINHHLYRACKRKVFVTMAAVAIDPASRRLEYARAGHNPIVWRRTRLGQTELRKPQGLGLGMCPTETFNRSLRTEQLDLEPGDAVVLYSDGITEAINGSMDQFGEERLIESIERADGQSAEATRAAILRDLADFAAGTPPRDDITVVVLRVAA
ncbi:MAG TPA: PP2C family protein-serine/threonine phosphatase [Bryobacteraceae bacterium]